MSDLRFAGFGDPHLHGFEQSRKNALSNAFQLTAHPKSGGPFMPAAAKARRNRRNIDARLQSAP